MSELSSEYIPMLNQLRTMQSPDLDHDERNAEKIVCQQYVNHILPKKAKNRLRGYRRKGAMRTTTTAKGSGKKRDVSEVVRHNCKVKVTMPTNDPAKKPLPGDTTTKWCPCTRRDHIQTMNSLFSRQPLNQLPLFLHCQGLSPLPQRLVHLRSW